ncbi:MAG: hypothetical protein B6I35_15385 [Anaerolineaceae bacterium 4572_32.2]|nr:MAG: hypothetical protein B6I35_15385 [Anaerolineaceae bacterium 4572_32.2]
MPIDTNGPLSFLGYTIRQRAAETELDTYWQVTNVPTRPLSIMAHLVTTDGIAVAVGDGLGVPIETWRPGDVIVQRHHLDTSQSDISGPYWLQTGGYWLDTMERWSITVHGQIVGNTLLLAEVSQ